MRSVEFFDNDRGEFDIWEDPIPGKHYIIGADIARNLDSRERKQKSDRSTICVLKRARGRVLEQVAEGCLRCDPTHFGCLMAAFGYYYNEAVLNPERNMADAVAAGIAQSNYPQHKWYIPPVSLSPYGAISNKYFFVKTKQTQGFLINTFIDYLSGGQLVLRSSRLVSELGSLQYEGQNVKTNGKDLSIAAMMAVVVDATTEMPLEDSVPTSKVLPDLPWNVDPAAWARHEGVKLDDVLAKREMSDAEERAEGGDWAGWESAE